MREFQRTLHLLTMTPLSLMGLSVIVVVTLVAVFAPVITHYSPIQINMTDALVSPSWQHIFGTDQLGRDIFSRIVYGARASLLIAIVVVCIAGSIGIFFGLVSGYFGGLTDNLVMRVADLFLAFPGIVLAMAIAAALGRPSFEGVIVALSVIHWPSYARLVRGSVLSVKESEFIEAAKATGEGPWSIIFGHVLPNVTSPLTVHATLDLGRAIILASTLGFVGLGVQPPTPEWGSMAADGRNFILHQWWISTLPGLAIFFVVMAFNLLGDGLRDAFDPRLRYR
jgi:peptide/nickel transport system permease protein